MKLPHRPSHGVIAGYAGLLLGTLAVAGAPAMAAGLINGKTIKKGTITSAKLAKSSVTASKIKTGAVTRPKLGKGSVTGAAIAAGAVDGARVEDLSLGVADLSLAARAVLRGGPVGASSVTTATIVSGAVTSDKLAAGAVTAAAVAEGAITATKVADGAITATKVADGAITESKVADGAITATKLADGAVIGSKIPAHAVAVVGHVNAVSASPVYTAVCPAGEKALGGGIQVDDTGFPTGVGAIAPIIVVSAPAVVGTVPTGWIGKVRDANTTLGADFTVYAICA